MITIHFLIFEQELILVLLLTFGLKTLNENNLLCLLLGILFIELKVVCLQVARSLVATSFLKSIELLIILEFYCVLRLAERKIMIELLLIQPPFLND